MGAAHARALVAEGGKVVIGDILDDEGKALADELGESARYVHLDVTEAEQWEAAVNVAVEAFGKVTALVNNAAIVALGQIGKFDMAKWQKVIDVNLTGTFLGMQAVVEEMKKAGEGSIINVSSIEGLRGAPMVHPYVASKWAVRGLAKSAAIELGPKNIRVNSIHPGFIRTPMTKHFPDDMVTAPLRRPGQVRRGVDVRGVPGQRRVIVRDRCRIHDGRRAGDRRSAQGPWARLIRHHRIGPVRDFSHARGRPEHREHAAKRPGIRREPIAHEPGAP